MHEKSARAVLIKLFPDLGSEIAGHVRSDYELLVSFGYESCQDFDDLSQMLDHVMFV